MKKSIYIATILTLLICSCANGNTSSKIISQSNTSYVSVTTSETQENNSKAKDFLKEDYEDFINKQIICENPLSLKYNSSTNLIEVNTYGSNYLILQFDGYIQNLDIKDIQLKAYNSDWYSLNPSIKDSMDIDSYLTYINKNGETVLILRLKEEIKGTRLKVTSQIKELSQEEIETQINRANNIITWQLDNGGWDKDKNLSVQATRPWNGSEAKNQFSGWKSKDGKPLGTIDNSATYTQMKEIATAYYYKKEQKYKDSFVKGLNFLGLLQYESGGFAQVYPRRGNYSDYVTLNDDAMASVLIMLEKIKNNEYPFNSDILNESQYQKVCKMIDDGIDYLLKAQIISKGKKSAWCAQHDPNNYKPLGGRAYEPISISGSESIGVIKFLMNQYDNKECVEAAEAAIRWLDENKQENLAFDKNTAPYFYESQDSTLWYRFYEIGTDKGIFGDRDGKVYHNIADISEERRTGYAWSGTWPNKIISTFKTHGYYANKILVSIKSNNSIVNNGTLNLTSSALSPLNNLKSN